VRRSRVAVAVAAAVLVCACSTDNGSKGGGGDGGGTADATTSDSGTPDAGGAGDGAAGGDAAQADAGGCGSGAAAKIQHPNPIVSRGRPVFASPSANANQINNGVYHNGGWSAGTPSASAPAWAAIQLAAGPTRVLLSWDDGGTYDYEDPASTTVYGLPADYEIDVSADSTNGADGTWTTAKDMGGNAIQITGNTARTRAHSFDFTGMTWVKMVITAAPPNISPNGVQIGEIDVHDVSAAGAGLPEDTWFFMGDSITAFAFDRSQVHQPSFAKTVSAESAGFYPAMINGGIGGETSADGLARLQNALTFNPDYRYFVLSYGTNDAGHNVGTSVFQSNMQSMITMLQAAGRVPVIPHIPWAGTISGIASYNAVVDQLVQMYNLTPGPDLYTYFQQHSSGDDASTNEFLCPPCAGGRMTDYLHPNDTGLTAMNTLWAQAMCPLYP